MNYFQEAMTLAHGQQGALQLERLAYLTLAGQCLCREPNRFGFKCPVHEAKGCCEGEHGV